MKTSIHICRVCMSKEKKTKLQRIFSENLKVANDLFFACGIMIVDIKAHPQSMICNRCLDEVTAAARIKKKALQSDIYFRNQTIRDEQELWNFIPPVCKVEPDIDDTNSPMVVFTSTIAKIEEEAKLEEEEESTSRGPVIEAVYSEFDSYESEKNEVDNYESEDYFGISETKKISKPKKKRIRPSRAGRFECDCGKVFAYKVSLSDHITVMHKDVPESEMFPCQVCPKKFKLQYQADRHIKKYHPDAKIELRSKERRTKGEKKPRKGRFECWCGKVFCYKGSLDYHDKIKHTDNQDSERIPCQICGKEFKLKACVDRHVKYAHVDNKKSRKAPCSVCGIFFVKAFLKRHEALHFKELNAPPKPKIYSCDLCGHSVSEKIYMRLHFERVHLRLKKFKCKLCSAAFVHGTLLESHVRTVHLNIRPFVCRHCPKAFVRQSCRKIHERIHTDERPYSCSFCEKTFIHHSDHRRHELRHTGGIPKKEFNARLAGNSVQKVNQRFTTANEFASSFPLNVF